jgi:peptidoglycan/xylan/chitin deacetylase (PgdA/CDA1 family)
MFSSSVFTLLTAALVITATPLSEKRQTPPSATIYSSCTVPNTVALTFDDGPYIYNQAVVDLLVAAGVKGSFFFNGNNYDCIYDADSIARVQYVYNHGMMVGDHTWAHADLTTLTAPQIEDGMYRMEEAFSRILGIKPAFMRPPYGNYNDDVLQIAYARNQSVALWDQDTEDGDGAPFSFSESVYANAVAQNLSTMLVLNHETIQTTSTTVLPYALNLLKSHGYNMVTLAECLGVEPYTAIGVPQTGTWTCDGTPDPGTGCAAASCETGTPTFLTATSTATAA